MSNPNIKDFESPVNRKIENLEAALWLHFAYYNFVRIHQSLRITPAMAAGITGSLWTLQDILMYEGKTEKKSNVA